VFPYGPGFHLHAGQVGAHALETMIAMICSAPIPAAPTQDALRRAKSLDAAVFVDNAKISGEGSRRVLASRLPESAATFVRPLRCSIKLFTIKSKDLNVRALRVKVFILAS